MSKELAATKDQGSPPVLTRRQLGVGLLAVLAGGLGVVNTAWAFSRKAINDFATASRSLAPYGVTVIGDDSSGYDLLGFEIVPLPTIEYSQIVGTRNRFGETEPCFKTSVFGDDASFTHFHPASTGEIIPCIKTTIEGHSLATHELFDSDQGGTEPCWRVTSDMLEGGHIGTIEAVHFHPTRTGEIIPCIKTTINEDHTLATHELFDAGEIVPCLKVASEMLDGGVLGAVDVTIDPGLGDLLRLHVDGNTYILRGSELVLEETPR